MGTWLRGLSAVLLTVGGIMQGIDMNGHVRPDLADSASLVTTRGVVMQVTAMFLSSQRWAVTQFSMQRNDPKSSLPQLPRLQFFACTTPSSSSVLLVAGVLFEDVRNAEFVFERMLRLDLLWRLLVIAAGVVMLSYAELALVHRISAVALNVCGSLHQIPVIITGMIIFHESVEWLGILGFTTCVIGGLVY